MSDIHGYRGYLTSRPVFGNYTPQKVQNLVIRDYCQRNSLVYLLGFVEYAITESFLILNQVVKELNKLEGVVLYSVYMLPRDKERRLSFLRNALLTRTKVIGALEEVVIESEEDIKTIEEMWQVKLATEGRKIYSSNSIGSDI